MAGDAGDVGNAGDGDVGDGGRIDDAGDDDHGGDGRAALSLVGSRVHASDTVERRSRVD